MAEKNKKQKVNYSPEKKKKKKDPMIIAVCVFGAVLLISLPVVGKILIRTIILSLKTKTLPDGIRLTVR